jgi:hypothetical protein
VKQQFYERGDDENFFKRRGSEDVSEFEFWREKEIFLLSTNYRQALGQHKFSE